MGVNQQYHFNYFEQSGFLPRDYYNTFNSTTQPIFSVTDVMIKAPFVINGPTSIIQSLLFACIGSVFGDLFVKQNPSFTLQICSNRKLNKKEKIHTVNIFHGCSVRANKLFKKFRESFYFIDWTNFLQFFAPSLAVGRASQKKALFSITGQHAIITPSLVFLPSQNFVIRIVISFIMVDKSRFSSNTPFLEINLRGRFNTNSDGVKKPCTGRSYITNQYQRLVLSSTQSSSWHLYSQLCMRNVIK